MRAESKQTFKQSKLGSSLMRMRSGDRVSGQEPQSFIYRGKKAFILGEARVKETNVASKHERRDFFTCLIAALLNEIRFA